MHCIWPFLTVNKTSEMWRHVTIITTGLQGQRDMNAVSRQLPFFEDTLQSTIDYGIRRCAWNNWSCRIPNAPIQPLVPNWYDWWTFSQRKFPLSVLSRNVLPGSGNKFCSEPKNETCATLGNNGSRAQWLQGTMMPGHNDANAHWSMASFIWWTTLLSVMIPTIMF